MNTIAADKVVKHELWIFSKPELAAIRARKGANRVQPQ